MKGKIIEILRESLGSRPERLKGGFVANDSIQVVSDALSDFGQRNALEVAFHLMDWGDDAAFILALYLSPEKFTAEEIRQGVEAFLIHAPNHIAVAAKLGGWPIEDIFEKNALNNRPEE